MSFCSFHTVTEFSLSGMGRGGGGGGGEGGLPYKSHLEFRQWFDY